MKTSELTNSVMLKKDVYSWHLSDLFISLNEDAAELVKVDRET